MNKKEKSMTKVPKALLVTILIIVIILSAISIGSYLYLEKLSSGPEILQPAQGLAVIEIRAPPSSPEAPSTPSSIPSEEQP